MARRQDQTNLFAGMGSHQSARAETDTWFTPPAVIEAVGGPDSFDLDPCSPAIRPWPTARQHYDAEGNGLMLPWFGRVWLNPPYEIGLITRFLGRMAEHDRGIALIFARTETDPFHRFVWGAASGLLFLRGRLHFHAPEAPDPQRCQARPHEWRVHNEATGLMICRHCGVAKRNGGAPSVLIAYGAEDRDILAAAPIDGAFVPLRLPIAVFGAALDQSWRDALAGWFDSREGPVTLAEIYRAFSDHPKTRANQHWRDKLRQVLQRGDFERVEKGVWKRRIAA